jgi:hypothetical protein
VRTTVFDPFETPTAPTSRVPPAAAGSAQVQLAVPAWNEAFPVTGVESARAEQRTTADDRVFTASLARNVLPATARPWPK